jgi:hypothetical protein
MARSETPQIADNNQELNAFLDGLVTAGMAVTNKWKDMWCTALQYTWGQMLRDINPKENWNYIVVNRIYPIMFQNIAKLSKNNPKIITHGWDEERAGVVEFVEQWSGILQYIWESPYELNMRLKLIKGLLDAGLFGYMVGKVIWEDKVKWDEENKVWVGNVKQNFVHPANFWCDPSADSVLTSENCGSQRLVKVEWAMNRWPDDKEDIKQQAFTQNDPRYIASSDLIYRNQKGSTLGRSKNKTVYSKLVDLIMPKGFGNSGQDGTVTEDKQEYVCIEEIYWKDYSEKNIKIEEAVPINDLVTAGLVSVEEGTGLAFDLVKKQPLEKEDHPTQVVREYMEPNYPNGRFVLRIGKTILNQKKNSKDIKTLQPLQKYRYSRWPFTVMPYHILPHMWQGGNAVEMVRNNNDMLNITMSAMVNQVERTADPDKLMEAGTMARDRKGRIRKVKFNMGKLIIVAKNKIDKVKNMVWAPVDPAVLNLAALMKQDIDDNSFSQPVSRGEIQKSGTTKAEAIRANVNSHDYTAMQAVFLDGFIDETCTLIAEIVQDNYSPGRMIRIKGVDNMSLAAISQGLLDVRFDVNIEPGSTLPFDEERKAVKYLQAYQLVGEPIPNPMIEEVLRVLDITDREKILAKYQGVVLFRQFIQMGQLAMQLDPEKVKAMPPELQPIYQLLIQAGQLAPQTGIQTSQGAA